MTRFIFISSICLLANFAFAFKFTPEICQNYGLGQYWYCKEYNNTSREISANEIMKSDVAPEEKAHQLNQLWELQRKRAVITAESQDIEKFLETHNLIINKGIDFAKITQNLIETSPKLSNSESYYKNIHEQIIKEQEYNEILENAHKRYGLVFIYSSTCPHCHRQLPIILKLQEKIKVMGISVDGNSFVDLNENIVDENITNDPMVQAFPTILLLDKKRPAKIFISKGLTSLADLEEKITRRIKEREDEEK
jgi:conjugal transfer pilus assembly protein TraF